MQPGSDSQSNASTLLQSGNGAPVDDEDFVDPEDALVAPPWESPGSTQVTSPPHAVARPATEAREKSVRKSRPEANRKLIRRR